MTTSDKTNAVVVVIGDFPETGQGLQNCAASVRGAEVEYLSLGAEGPQFSQDPLYQGYLPAMQQARQELARRLGAAGKDQRFALIGRGLGGLVALWAAADSRTAPVRALVAISSTPNLDYLKDKHPYYSWPADDVKKVLLDWDVSYKVPRIGPRAVLLIHSDNDPEIRANWAEEFFLLATGVSKWPQRWDYHRIPGLPHVWKDPLQEPCRQAQAHVAEWLEQYLDPVADPVN